ncbi:hypothetical protein ONZ45_g9159 [Pleurotus djamor]|nr:hypothetical protein ONZ45_g9159 [Pleurotus djamor]
MSYASSALYAVLYVVLGFQLLSVAGSIEDIVALLVLGALQVAPFLVVVVDAVVFWYPAMSVLVNVMVILASMLLLWLIPKIDVDFPTATTGPSTESIPTLDLALICSPPSSPESSCPSTPTSEVSPSPISIVEHDDTPCLVNEVTLTSKDELPTETMDEPDIWYPDLDVPWIEHKIPVGGKARASGLSMTDLDLTAPLGTGAFSAVFKATTTSGKLFAAKIIVKDYIHPHPKVQFSVFKQEVLALSKVCGHPSFMNIHGAFESDDLFALVLRCYDNGTLEDLMARNGGRLSYNRARWMTAELLEGLDFLHKNGVIYRDLKPSNILIDDDGHAIFTDFGLSHVFPPTYGDELPAWKKARRRGGEDFPPLFPTTEEEMEQGLLMNMHVVNDAVGSRAYAAPEVLNGEVYSYGVDFYAMGILLYEMVTGELPYVEERQVEEDEDDEDGLAAYTLDLELPLMSGLPRPSGTLLSFLEQILLGSDGTPNSRLNVSGMREHPYFANVDWIDVMTRPMKVPV